MLQFEPSNAVMTASACLLGGGRGRYPRPGRRSWHSFSGCRRGPEEADSCSNTNRLCSHRCLPHSSPPHIHRGLTQEGGKTLFTQQLQQFEQMKLLNCRSPYQRTPAACCCRRIRWSRSSGTPGCSSHTCRSYTPPDGNAYTHPHLAAQTQNTSVPKTSQMFYCCTSCRAVHGSRLKIHTLW